MKKTLALVLALLMVLALVPTAFATTILTDDAEHKIEVTVRIDDADIDSIEICKANGWTHDHKALEWYKTFSATGKNPTVNVEVPYGMIDELPGTGIWDSDVLDVQVKVSGLYYSWNRYDYKDDEITVTLGGKDVTEDIDFGNPVSTEEAKAEYQAQIDKYNNQLNYIAQVTEVLAVPSVPVDYSDWGKYAEAVFDGYEFRKITGYKEYNDIVVEKDYTSDNARATSTPILTRSMMRRATFSMVGAEKPLPFSPSASPDSLISTLLYAGCIDKTPFPI